MQKNTDKYYKTLVKDRLIPANKNKTYKELVDVLFSDTVDCIEPKILRKTKKEVVSILLNLSKSSFSEGVVFGFKFGLDIAASGNPIIVKNSQTEERRKLARNSGIKSGLKRNEHKEQFYQAFIKNRMWHSTHKDILADADIKKLIKDAGISDVTADKKWIPYAMKRRLEEKAERKVTRTS